MRWMLALIALLLAGPAALAQAPARPAPPPAESLAAPGRPGWMVAARNGCWVWNAFPSPGASVTWSGGCPRGPAQGQGQVEWRRMENGQPRVDRFTGTLREGRMEGRGTYTRADGDRYEGEWRDGRMNGRGTRTSADGGRYEGEYRDGRLHGRGTITWANGDRYEGEWRDDRADGYGEYYIAAQRHWYRGPWTGGCYRGADGRAAIGRPLAECP